MPNRATMKKSASSAKFLFEIGFFGPSGFFDLSITTLHKCASILNLTGIPVNVAMKPIRRPTDWATVVTIVVARRG